MPTDYYRNHDNTVGSRQVKTDAEIEDAMTKGRLSSTAGAGLGSKGKALTGAPRQEPGESPSAYGERMRKWRETQTQQKAFSK